MNGSSKFTDTGAPSLWFRLIQFNSELSNVASTGDVNPQGPINLFVDGSQIVGSFPSFPFSFFFLLIPYTGTCNPSDPLRESPRWRPPNVPAWRYLLASSLYPSPHLLSSGPPPSSLPFPTNRLCLTCRASSPTQNNQGHATTTSARPCAEAAPSRGTHAPSLPGGHRHQH